MADPAASAQAASPPPAEGETLPQSVEGGSKEAKTINSQPKASPNRNEKTESGEDDAPTAMSPTTTASTTPKSPREEKEKTRGNVNEARPKRDPYVNPNRVQTGGAQRVRLFLNLITSILSDLDFYSFATLLLALHVGVGQANGGRAKGEDGADSVE